jgi:hypothetical protein
MKRIYLAILLFLTACGAAQSAGSPGVIVNQYPTLLPTPTLAVLTKTIEEDEKAEALDHFYEMKLRMASKEYDHFAEEIRYPITVKVDGQPQTFVYAAEFEANFEKIFSPEEFNKFISTDESELTFTPNGVKIADGLVWFDLICMDPSCENSEFLITQINN